MKKICGLLAALALLVATPARADEIKVMTSGAFTEAYQQLVEQLQDEWNHSSDVSGTQVQPDPGDPTAIIRIPRFGDDYAVPLVEGVSDDALASGDRMTDSR